MTAAGADTGLGEEVAAVGDKLIVLIDPESAFGELLPRKPATARRRRTTSARPRASSRSMSSDG